MCARVCVYVWHFSCEVYLRAGGKKIACSPCSYGTMGPW